MIGNGFELLILCESVDIRLAGYCLCRIDRIVVNTIHRTAK